jgi:signal transduction histidine kinase
VESAQWFLGRAEEILGELGARYELARLEVERGELASARGERENAVTALRRAIDAFEQLGARWDLARTRTRLKSLAPEGPAHRQAESPRVLLEMAHASARIDVDAVLIAGLDRVLELTQLDRGFILLLDEDGRPRQRVRRERTGAFGPGEVEFSASIVKRVASTGEAVSLADIDSDGPVPPSFSVISLGLRRVMSAPMLARGRVIGIVYVDSRGSVSGEDAGDVSVLEAFAAEASAVVESARLEGEVQRKGELMAILAHEIRNPLAGILGFSEIGCTSVEDDKTRELFERIKRDGERLRRLVDNVLELARHDAGKVDWLFEPVDMAALVDEVVDMFRPACAEKSLELEVQTSDLTAKARASADRIAQVISNLVGNAVKFTPAGGKITVAARTEIVGADDPEAPPVPASATEAWGPVEPVDRAPGSYVRVDVIDTGPGMSEEIRANLFQKFRQGTTARRKGKGVGLGLYISREIISRHGGSIWVLSRKGEGAKFSFRLPVAE